MPETGIKGFTENQMLVLHAFWNVKDKQHNKRHLDLASFINCDFEDIQIIGGVDTNRS